MADILRLLDVVYGECPNGQFEDDTKVKSSVQQALDSLKPIHFRENEPLVPELSDHLDFACGKGGLRRFNIAGLYEFRLQNFVQLANLYTELIDQYPDAAASGFFLEWHRPAPPEIVQDTAFGHPKVHLWLNTLCWCQSSESWAGVSTFEERAISLMREGVDPAKFIDLPHGTRSAPIERRFPQSGKLARLRALKKTFDPLGVFSDQLL